MDDPLIRAWPTRPVLSGRQPVTSGHRMGIGVGATDDDDAARLESHDPAPVRQLIDGANRRPTEHGGELLAAGYRADPDNLLDSRVEGANSLGCIS